MYKIVLFLLLSTLFWQASCERPYVENKSKFTAKQEYIFHLENVNRKNEQTQESFIPEVTLYFDYNKYFLSPIAKSKLDEFYSDVLVKDRQSTFFVEGNTDTSGTEEYNLKLSEERANIVVSYLVGLGASASQFQVLARGELNPIANDNEYPELNRRVIVYKKESF